MKCLTDGCLGMFVADIVVLVTCFILVLLFALQHIGTRRISFLFAPVVLAWLFCNCSIGIYNLVRFNPGIIRALSPYYIYRFFRVAGKDGWIALGGVLLCITGRSPFMSSCSPAGVCSVRRLHERFSLGFHVTHAGSEAMYADLGHFSRRSIKFAFTSVVYPSLLLGYMGQAAYLSKNLQDIDHSFFHSIPSKLSTQGLN